MTLFFAVWLYMFFFFKQKTAYEMRISDWSSDVCSSDLAGVTSALDFRQAESLLTQAETELAGLHLAKAQNDNFLAVLTGGPLPAGLHAPMPLADQKSGQEIGRASCRERVCQYV